MMNRLCLAAVCLLLSYGAALANADSVRCVQAQLNAAGRAAGTVDGIIGGRTRTALSQFARDAYLSRDMPLVETTAPHWCRRIGLADPALQDFWPSRVSVIEVDLANDITPDLAEAIQVGAPLAHTRATTTLGLQVAGTDALVVASDAATLRRMIAARTNATINGLNEKLDQMCNGSEPITGATAAGVTFLCVQPGLRLAGHQRLLDLMLAHEVVHLLQLQVVGLPPAETRGRTWPTGLFPMWVIEGSAHAYAFSALDDAKIAQVRPVFISSFRQRDIPDLADLEQRSALQTDEVGVYNGGAIAVTYLVEEAGFRALGRLYSAMGKPLTRPLRSRSANRSLNSTAGFSIVSAHRAQHSHRVWLRLRPMAHPLMRMPCAAYRTNWPR